MSQRKKPFALKSQSPTMIAPPPPPPMMGPPPVKAPTLTTVGAGAPNVTLTLTLTLYTGGHGLEDILRAISLRAGDLLRLARGEGWVIDQHHAGAPKAHFTHERTPGVPYLMPMPPKTQGAG